MDWTREAWEAAIVALRERGSASELLALYEEGAICGLEVLTAAWEQCHDKPSVRVALIAQFRNYANEYIAEMVGGGLEKLAAQACEQAGRHVNPRT